MTIPQPEMEENLIRLAEMKIIQVLKYDGCARLTIENITIVTQP
jgi:hypothetical protein